MNRLTTAACAPNCLASAEREPHGEFVSRFITAVDVSRGDHCALGAVASGQFMVKNIVMFKVNVFEVKAKLSEYLDRAARGERIVICRHNKPVAELRPVSEMRTEPRPIGPLPGRPRFDVPASFFTTMPPDELDLWEGVAPTDPLGSAAGVRKARVPKVAERRASYRPSNGRARRRRS